MTTLQRIPGSALGVAADSFARRVVEARAEHTHLWIAAVSYFVDPPIERAHVFDVSTITGPPAIGCYVCEQGYSFWRAQGPCPGDPARR